MTLPQLVLILISVSLTTLAQLLLKAGASGPAFASAAGGGLMDFAFAVLKSPAIIAGFAVYAASALLWLIVLKQVDVSVAYPFVALGFVAVMAVGAIAFGEPVGGMRIAGTALIALGVALVARSA